MVADMNSAESEVPSCHICGSRSIVEIPAYRALRRVTSDCQPWPAGGRLISCNDCSCIQKSVDAQWKAEIRKIYSEYAIYHQSGGAEQVVYPAADGHAVARSIVLLERVAASVALAPGGRLLDVGCGNGSLLRAFRRLKPDWQVAGADINPNHRGPVEKIGGPGSFHLAAPEDVPGQFNLITLVHSLEHIPAPLAYLERLKSKLTPDGHLMVHVPSYERNPFELLVADHSTHFSWATTKYCLERAGFALVASSSEWVPKEMTFVTRAGASGAASKPPEELREITRRLSWLEQLILSARRLSEAGSSGIFGTSIAATWLYSELEGRISFFVDEDPNLRGRRLRDLPILHPDELGNDQQVFVALPDWMARKVCARLNRGGATYHPPPALED
jgi:SAM-dependent methyltransferase